VEARRVVTARSLNILYAGTLPPHPGGSAISASQLLAGIARAGHRVRALGPVTAATEAEARSFEERHPELMVRRYTIPQYYTRVYEPAGATHHEAEGMAVRHHLAEMLVQERPDLVFAGREMYAWYVPEALRGVRIPMLLRVAGGTLFGLMSQQYPAASSRDLVERLRQFDLLVTPAVYMARQLQAMGVPQVRTIVNAVSVADIALGAPDPALRRALGLDDEDRVILSIGNLHARKRSLDIVRAVEQVLVREPRAVCVMIGLGQLKEEIIARTTANGTASRFRLPGWIDYRDVPRYLSIAELVVHAAEGEGLARAWLESQAAGVPLVVADIEAAREIATDGETALFFPVGDVDAMAERVLVLLGDGALRARLGRAARARVEAHDLPRAVDAWIGTIRELVDAHRARQ